MKTYGPSNETDTIMLHRRGPSSRTLAGAFDWSTDRPLREQWPWCGGTREEWELTQRPTVELPVVRHATPRDPTDDVVGNSGSELLAACAAARDEAIRRGAVIDAAAILAEASSDWPDADLDDEIRASEPVQGFAALLEGES